MKRITTLSVILLINSILFAQSESDSVSLGAGYENASFYSLANGEIARVNNLNWDLAFDVSAFGSAIHINDQAGTELYVYPLGDTSSWSSVDTSGIASWKKLYNTDTSWSVGAFNRSADLSDPYDLGWGLYNTITHAVTGDSLYIVKLPTAELKQLHIIELFGGVYSFRYADLDGGNLVNASLNKDDYTGKNFVYYSIQTDEVLDREPEFTAWDLLFTKYTTELSPAIFYGVTGVLLNNGIEAAKAYPVSNTASYTDHEAHSFNSPINTIGYDWKYFDNSTFTFILEDSLCYFVRDSEGAVWRIHFTSFEGSSTGKLSFSKERLLVSGIEAPQNAINSFGLYPNPARNYVNVFFDAPDEETELSLFNLSGKRVLNQQLSGKGFQNHLLPVDELESGMYMLVLQSGRARSIRQLIIH